MRKQGGSSNSETKPIDSTDTHALIHMMTHAPMDSDTNTGPRMSLRPRCLMSVDKLWMGLLLILAASQWDRRQKSTLTIWTQTTQPQQAQRLTSITLT